MLYFIRLNLNNLNHPEPLSKSSFLLAISSSTAAEPGAIGIVVKPFARFLRPDRRRHVWCQRWAKLPFSWQNDSPATRIYLFMRSDYELYFFVTHFLLPNRRDLVARASIANTFPSERSDRTWPDGCFGNRIDSHHPPGDRTMRVAICSTLVFV